MFPECGSENKILDRGMKEKNSDQPGSEYRIVHLLIIALHSAVKAVIQTKKCTELLTPGDDRPTYDVSKTSLFEIFGWELFEKNRFSFPGPLRELRTLDPESLWSDEYFDTPHDLVW